MKQKRLSDVLGLRLSRQALRVLKERGIFAHSPVSLEHQHLAKRYVVRGLESGGAVGDLGRYVTFAQEDGQPIECLHPVEAIGVNGLHAVVVAPVLVRIEMLRKGRTYELLITQHRPGRGKRWQATSTGDEGSVSWHSRSAGSGSVRKGQRPSRCCIADVLLARRRRSHNPKTVSRGDPCHHEGGELRWLFALSLFQSVEGRKNTGRKRRTRKSKQRGKRARSRGGVKGVEGTCMED